MNNAPVRRLEPLRFENGRPLLIAGLGEHCVVDGPFTETKDFAVIQAKSKEGAIEYTQRFEGSSAT